MYKILFVDDDYAIRFLYQSELEDEGYSVMTTNDVRGLSGHIKQFKPDILLLDVRCGETGGVDVLKEIKSRQRNMPVILCSAYDSFLHDNKAMGADYYVSKSIDLTELKSTIKTAFDKLLEDESRYTPGHHEQHSVPLYV
ncbi:Response regulator receiver protein [uncultured Desulfobacterium sp.]|uniref:Response regulator receiver protein n=1 Tax=uncultured Desulfobacterium sp. TaxID=201089 RepID=A0A445N2V2_9BACT|nr:Response regulator receiver protein [uncultured Desulfobacterium sp.]